MVRQGNRCLWLKKILGGKLPHRDYEVLFSLRLF